jgi:hypothetical protein
VVLKNAVRDFSLSSTGLSPSVVDLSRHLRLGRSFFTLRQHLGTTICALQPSNNISPKTVRIFEFRLVPLRSPLLRESHSISFPQGTKMFQFPWCPPAYAGAWVLPMRVTPLGNPRIGLLDSSPGLFAVMPRPSSATDAKASALRPFLFDLLQLEHKTGHTTLLYVSRIFRSIQLLMYLPF